MKYWLVKTEPSTYSWQDLVRDQQTNWNGIRNYGARNNLRAMKEGDLVFVYHSVNEKAILGVARVVKEAYPEESDWSQVDLEFEESLKRKVTLEEIKKNEVLKQMVLVKNSRLSVQPVAKREWDEIEEMSNV